MFEGEIQATSKDQNIIETFQLVNKATTCTKHNTVATNILENILASSNVSMLILRLEM